MKITDLHYYETIYNLENEVSDIIANLNYPQKYIQLCLNGELYNLQVSSVDDKKFIVMVDGKVKEKQV